MKKMIYVTGSGSCGTHVVSRYLASILPNAYEFSREHKTWEEDPPAGELLARHDYVIFHRPRPNLARLRALFPGAGFALLMLRNPVQYWGRRSYASVRYLFQSGSFLRREVRHVPRANFILLVNAFAQADLADATWRLEDFSRDAATRHALLRSAIGVDVEHEPADLAVRKTFAALAGGVQPVGESQYANVLSRFEHEALRHAFDEVPQLARYYPHALSRCEVLDADDPRFFELRYAGYFREYPARRIAQLHRDGRRADWLGAARLRVEFLRRRRRVRRMLCDSPEYRFDYRAAVALARRGDLSRADLDGR